MNSLERRLQYSLAAILVMVLIGLLAITNISTRHFLEEFVTSRLEHDARNLMQVLEKQEGFLKVRWRRMNPIYQIPNSGHYYVVASANQVIRSPSLQSETLPIPPSKSLTIQREIVGPEHQRLISWSNSFTKDGENIVILVAEDMTLLKERRERFRWLFIMVGVAGIVLMLLIQRYIIHRMFKLLDQTRDEVKQIEAGKKDQLSEEVPVEIYPLVKEFNHTLSLMRQRLERSRNSLGNLAHALKTPLSILVQTLDMDKETNREANIQSRLQAERIRQLTERELKRARMAGVGKTTQRFNPHEELPVLCDVLKQAHGKPSLIINLQLAENIAQFGDREDMLELLGNLLDNACKWSASQVACSVKKQAENIAIRIEDDGNGRTPEEIEQLTQRGVRLDESVEGHGLGLAICKDIVNLYGGEMHFGSSQKMGGFMVEILLPE